ncbi:MAG: DUF4469 domain-containing protein [Spirochaetaceae bacterium]|nr:DUF4469 domain-containing protein [Spirochaetaceae bacterium]
MNTNSIQTLGGSVNVTIHKNYLREGDNSYAKVQRTTAGMDNVIATILNHTKVFDEASLVATVMLFKDAVLELLTQGAAINLFELGTLYPCAQGNIPSANPNISEIPHLSLGFTPSQEALKAVGKADISMAKAEETLPQISRIEDLATHSTDCTVSAGQPVRITGRRLRIAGDEAQVGLYFAQQNDNGKINENEAEWVKADSSSFFKNTHTYLELILPATLESSKSYFIVIRSASGRGKTINKTVKEMIYDTPVKVN